MQTNERKNTENFKITGNWEAQSQQLKTTYPQLTEPDLKFEAGKEDELVNRVSNRLGKKRDEVIQIIKKSEQGATEQKSSMETQPVKEVSL